MILDTIQNRLTHYETSLEQGLKWAESLMSQPLIPGRIEGIDGQYAIVCVNETQNVPVLFEAHQQYIDVHVCVSGAERLLYAPISKLIVKEAYQKEKDCAFYEGEPVGICDLSSGQFVVFYPEDGHQPNISVPNKENSVHKIIIKIPTNQ